MRLPVPVGLALTLILSTAAHAESKLLVAPFSGPKATVSRGQLLKTVCTDVECVPVGKGTTRGKLDWKKLKQHKVGMVLTGRVVKKKLVVELIRKPAGRPAWKKAFVLAANGRLNPAALKEITKKVNAALGGGSDDEGSDEEEEAPRHKSSEPVASAPDTSSEDSESTSASSSDSSSSTSSSAAPGFGQLGDSESGSSSESSSSASEEVASSEGSRSRRSRSSESDASDSDAEVRSSGDEDSYGGPSTPLVTAQVGLDLLSRSYAVGGLTTANLRDYSAPLIVAPRIRLEVNPMARGGGAAAGLGLEADFALSLALKSGVAGAQTFPTSMTRMDLGLLYAFKPLAHSQFALVPHLGYRKQSFQVNAASDGTTLDGLPPISYGGIRLALGLDAPLSSRVLLFGLLGFMPSLSTGAIGADPFFPGSKASGLEVGAGAGYLVSEKIELRLNVQLTRYSLALKPATGGAFQADSASDQYLGAALGARYRY